MQGFKGLAEYQKFRKQDWENKGYILLNAKTGHKAYIYDYQRLINYFMSFKDLGFWDLYRELRNSNPNSYTVQKVKTFFKRKSASAKQSVNYPRCMGHIVVILYENRMNCWKPKHYMQGNQQPSLRED